MNKATRLLTMAGMGAIAALAISGGAAQAATGSTATAAKPAAPQAKAPFGWDRTVAVYRSGAQCEFAGTIGERSDDWDDYECDYIGAGRYELVVSNWDGRPGFYRHGFRGHFVGLDRFRHGGFHHGGDHGHHGGDHDHHDGDHHGHRG